MKYEITEDESNRLSVLKVWLSIMVVFIHSYSEEINFTSETVALEVPRWLQLFKYLVSQEISRCAVPAFFCISAILLFKKNFDWKSNIIKKCKTLMLPYFLLNTFWIIFFCIVQNIPILKGYFSNPGNIVADWGWKSWIDKFLGVTGYPICYPLWFVRDLFVLNVLAYVIKKVIDLFPKFVFGIVVLLWIFNVNLHIFCMSTQSLCFFAMGYYIVKYDVRLSDIDKIKCSHISIMYSCFLLIELLIKDCSAGMFIHNINIMLGIVFWFRCATVLKGKKIRQLIHFVSRYSFGIYLFHEMNLTILKKICCKILPQTVVIQLLEYVGIPLLIVFCCIVLCFLMEKWIPSLYSILTGGRRR